MTETVATIADPTSNALPAYVNAVRAKWRAERDLVDVVDEVSHGTSELERKRGQLGWWQKLKTLRSHRRQLAEMVERQSSAERDFEKQLTTLKQQQRQALTKLLGETIDAGSAKADLLAIQHSYETVSSLADSHRKTVDAGNRVLREIDEAQSAVSSAQTTEVFDMMSSNKGISALSTMSSMSASSEVDDVKRAMKRFTKALEEHQATVEGLGHDLSLEYLDFGFDLLGLNDGFDFGSALSLMSLSSTGSDLDKAEREVKKVLSPLQKAHKALAEERDKELRRFTDAKSKEFGQVRKAVKSAGVPEPDESMTHDVIANFRIDAKG